LKITVFDLVVEL